MEAKWFKDDEPGFAAWREAHAQGFFVNAEYSPSPRYLVLHRVDCPTFEGRTNFTSPGYSKLCSGTIAELLAAVRRDVGAANFSKSCNVCHPHDGGMRDRRKAENANPTQATTIDVQARLEYARAGVAVLRGLHISKTTMRYAEFARAIGLMAAGDKWEAWHRGQVTDILNLMAAAARQGGGADVDTLHFELIFNADGKPGAGFWKSSRIVSE